jgi:hypothetical protein
MYSLSLYYRLMTGNIALLTLPLSLFPLLSLSSRQIIITCLMVPNRLILDACLRDTELTVIVPSSHVQCQHSNTNDNAALDDNTFMNGQATNGDTSSSPPTVSTSTPAANAFPIARASTMRCASFEHFTQVFVDALNRALPA